MCSCFAGPWHSGIIDKHGRGPGRWTGDVPAPGFQLRGGRNGAPQDHGAPQTGGLRLCTGKIRRGAGSV